jgi:hypothetical protein
MGICTLAPIFDFYSKNFKFLATPIDFCGSYEAPPDEHKLLC